jgi:hypothetical protein
MKLKKLLLILGGILSFVLLVFSLVVLVILLKLNWWFFLGTLIGVGLTWITIGLIMLIRSRPLPATIKLDVQGAVQNSINLVKSSREFADNLLVKNIKLGRYGKQPETPILIVEGVGTETNNKITILTNLNNPKEETPILINKTEKEILEQIYVLAEHPAERTIEDIEETTAFGVPTRHTKRFIPSSQIERDNLEKKEAERKENI